ncbi:hypothetical protein Tco_0813656 [Tanacetum coccineum]
MYKVNTVNKQEVRTHATKSVLTSTGLKDVSSVRKPSSKALSSKNSVLSNTRNQSGDVEVHVRKNKKTNVMSKKNVVQTKKIVTNVDVKNALKVKYIILWIVDSGCSKHMIGNLKLLKYFVEKFMGIIRFGNDHFEAIKGYGDYVLGNVTICHVYYVEVLEDMDAYRDKGMGSA